MEKLEIPFKGSFSHASATRSSTETVLVVAESDDGEIGYGEGCPRSYVTGETIETALNFFNEHSGLLEKIESIDELKKWVNDNSKVIDKNPAAWCAVELSLLDLLGQVAGEPIETILNLPTLSGFFKYTAVLGTGSIDGFKEQVKQYGHVGFTDFKLKVSGNLNDDKLKIETLTALVDKPRIRLDANNLWCSHDEAATYIKSLEHSFFAIEEPLETGDYEGLKKMSELTSMPMILDESFLVKEDFNNLTGNPKSWIINLRVSKMGGIVRSLDIAIDAKSRGIAMIIGAQVGETSILTRGALTVANSYSDILLAQEGAFGTYLLERDITAEPITFGREGLLSVDKFGDKSGLGIDFSF